MDKKCLKCGHVTPVDLGTEPVSCQSCGAVYAKVEAARSLGATSQLPRMRATDTKTPWGAVMYLMFVVCGIGLSWWLYRLEVPTAVPDPKVAATVAPPVVASPAIEKSSFFVKYPPVRKAQWALRSGGTNFSYSFPDPDNPGQSFGFSLGPDASNITRADVSWHGTSISAPARLTLLREEFLRDWLRAVFPEIDAERVVAIAREEQARNYDGGSGVMPRKRVPGFDVIAGTVASSLVVGVER